jgi:anti-sigma-K factor RskA
MIDDRQQELAALHAFDLLEGPERAAFEAELQKNSELQSLVRQLQASAADLALTAPQVSPSPALKHRILSQLPTAGSAPASVTKSQVLLFRPSVFVPWAIAAGLAITCLWIGQLYLNTRAERLVLQDQQKLAELELASVRNQGEAERLLSTQQLKTATDQLAQLNTQVEQSTNKVAEASRLLDQTFQDLDRAKAALASREQRVASLNAELLASTSQLGELKERLRAEGDLAQFKIATLASMAGNSPQALAVAVWNPSTQQGVLRVDKLPALASDKDYQLWVIDPAYPAPVDGGVFTVDPATGRAQVSFRPNQRVNHATKFAVSLERKGGVPKAEGPIVLLGD